MRFSLQYILLIFIFLGFTACKESEDHSFTITAQIEGMSAQPVILEELGLNDARLVDSVRSGNNGQFTLQGTYKQPGLYGIRLGNQFLLMVVDGPKIELKADWRNLDAYTISGSQGSASLKQFLDKYEEYNKELIGLKIAQDSLLAQDAPDSLLRVVAQEGDKKYLHLIEFVKGYSDTTQSLPVAVFGASKLINLNDQAEYLEQFAVQMEKRFEPSKLSTDFLRILQAKLASQKALTNVPQIGKKAPAFSGPSIEGETRSLDDYRGKYLLIDFWASWCPPCRAENPNVVAAYKKYKDRNFTILGVSLDEEKAQWEQAVKEDKLTWDHVSDLKGWESEIAALYGVQAIPTNFLIDPRGEIIAINLRGDDLPRKLESILRTENAVATKNLNQPGN